MNFRDDLERELGPYFEDRAKRIFYASVVSLEGQVVSTGQAILECDAPVGIFWLEKEWPKDRIPDDVTSLKKFAEDRKIAIRTFPHCHCAFRDHYHFEFDP